MDDTYSGSKIPAEESAEFLRKAYLFLKNITLGRIDDYSEDEGVKTAVAAVAEALYVSDSHFGITSENNDGYSVAFASDCSDDALYRIAARYLPPGILCGRCDVVW